MAQTENQNRSKRDIEFLVVKKNWQPYFDSLAIELKNKNNIRAIELCNILIKSIDKISPPRESKFYNYEIYLNKIDFKTNVDEPIYPSYNFYISNILGRKTYFINTKNDLEKNIFNQANLQDVQEYYFHYNNTLIFAHDWIFKPSINFSSDFLNYFDTVFNKIEVMRSSDTFRFPKYEMPVFMKNSPEESFFLIDNNELKKVIEILKDKKDFLGSSFSEEFDLLSEICSEIQLNDGILLFR